ncbi:MAG: 4-alpha-glucanotransferase [Candidatus Acidiferrum sp.]
MTDLRAWGIDQGYWDVFGHWHAASDETKSRVLQAMEPNGAPQPGGSPVLVMTEGSPGIAIDEPAELQLEDGSCRRIDGLLPIDLPLGYHSLRYLESGRQVRTIVAPSACYLPHDLQIWGWSVQLYSLRSKRSWGTGDLADLRRFSAWASTRCGAGLVMTNPLGAVNPIVPQQSSPYFPSSRLFLNPLYLCIEEVPGAAEALPNLESLAIQGRSLSERQLIDRDAIYELKMSALRAIWTHAHPLVDSANYEGERGKNLHSFATFCALAEKYGPKWRTWPSQYRRPDSPALAHLPEALSERVNFFKWLQCLLDSQLEKASNPRMIMQDLPIGTDPDGADAWMWQDIFAKNVNVGAPPDEFNTEGQDWGLSPFIPQKLRGAGYEPFIHTVRSALRHALALRIDHVMGLFRLFWIPRGGAKRDGTYVNYRADELLAILALESVRAQAFVVGEDLGTVDGGVREQLAKFRILSYRLMWFEENYPEHYPTLALAAISTHDLPTISGVWAGADLQEQESLGLPGAQENSAKLRNRIKQVAGLDDNCSAQEAILRSHAALGHAPSAVLLASIDDAIGAECRPNLPGTVDDQRPNWRIPLPKNLEEIEDDPGVLQIAQSLARRTPGTKGVGTASKS